MERGERERPECLRENEEARETHGVVGVLKLESIPIAEIGRSISCFFFLFFSADFGFGGGVEEVVVVVEEEVLSRDQVEGIQPQRGLHVERWTAEAHHTECQRLGSRTGAHASLFVICCCFFLLPLGFLFFLRGLEFLLPLLK